MKYLTLLLILLFLSGCFENVRHKIGITTKPLQSGEQLENSTKLNYKITFGKIRPKEDIFKKYGRIINLASVAPFMPLSGGGLYSPTKIFQIKFAESIQIQYLDKGIYCSAVCPGLTRTEMHEIPSNLPNWLWMDSRTVAQQGFNGVMKGKTLIINGTLNNF